MGQGETHMKNWGQRGAIAAIVSSILLLVTAILFYIVAKQGATLEQEGAYAVMAIIMMILAVITLSLGAYAINVVKNADQLYLQAQAATTQKN